MLYHSCHMGCENLRDNLCPKWRHGDKLNSIDRFSLLFMAHWHECCLKFSVFAYKNRLRMRLGHPILVIGSFGSEIGMVVEIPQTSSFTKSSNTTYYYYHVSHFVSRIS